MEEALPLEKALEEGSMASIPMGVRCPDFLLPLSNQLSVFHYYRALIFQDVEDHSMIYIYV